MHHYAKNCFHIEDLKVIHKIFRDCENGRKNSENVPSYDGNFMGHIRTDCCDGIPLSVENFNMEHGNKILKKKCLMH